MQNVHIRHSLTWLSMAIVGLLSQISPVSAQESSTIVFRGTILTGPYAGEEVSGTANFPNELQDLIPGSFEDWWEIYGFGEYSYSSISLAYSTSTGSYSSLRIKDKVEGDALRFDVDSDDGSGNSIILLLDQGDSEALLPGSGGLSGDVPGLVVDPASFVPCQQSNGSWSGSCSSITATGGGQLFQLTEFSIVPPREVLSCVGFRPPADAALSVRKNRRALPMRMTLLDSDGMQIWDIEPPIVSLTFAPPNGEPSSYTDELEYNGYGDDGNMFVWHGAEWGFNLSTKGLAAGTYKISAVSGGVSYTIEDPGCTVTLYVY